MRTSFAIIAIAAALAAPSVCRAEFTVQIPDVAVQSQTYQIDSFFDIFFESVSGDPDLAAYMITLRLTGVDGNVGAVEFAEPYVANPTAPHDPIFPSNPPLTNTNPFDKSDATTIRAHADLPSGSVVIQEGKGLMRVFYSVAPLTVGTWNVTCQIDKGAATSFTDGDGSEYVDDVDYWVNAGRITVFVPAPAAFIGALPLLGLLAWRRRVS